MGQILFIKNGSIILYFIDQVSNNKCFFNKPLRIEKKREMGQIHVEITEGAFHWTCDDSTII